MCMYHRSNDPYAGGGPITAFDEGYLGASKIAPAGSPPRAVPRPGGFQQNGVPFTSPPIGGLTDVGGRPTEAPRPGGFQQNAGLPMPIHLGGLVQAGGQPQPVPRPVGFTQDGGSPLPIGFNIADAFRNIR